MQTRVSSIRISQELAEEFAAQYGTHNSGVKVAAQNYLRVKERTLLEIKRMNILTLEELKFLLALTSKMVRTKTHMTNLSLISYITEFTSINEGNKSVLLYEALSRKINALTAAQAYFLLDRLFVFWEQKEQEKKIINELIPTTK